MERRRDQPPPDRWEDFEDHCLKLWRLQLLGAKKNGRKGQPQAGVDIYGRHPANRTWWGIQCKQKTGWPRNSISFQEIEKEILKAEEFRPSLAHFVIATTTPRSAAVQKLVRELSERRSAQGRFTVELESWDDLMDRQYETREMTLASIPDGGFHAFLICSDKDLERAKFLTEMLEAEGMRVLSGFGHSPPGVPWKDSVGQWIRNSKSCVILIGSESLAPWEPTDIEDVLSGRLRDAEFRIIPVVFPGAADPAATLPFLGHLDRIEFASMTDFESLKHLIARIRGVDPGQVYVSERVFSIALERVRKRQEDRAISEQDVQEEKERALELRRLLREGGILYSRDTLCERFRLIEPIGQGGFATVWKAYDRTLEKLVAVKVLHGQYAHDRTRRERFFRGARRMQELHHQGIVQVIEKELEDHGFYFFVMEFLAGGDFRRAVLERRLSIGERIGILIEMGRALEFAHHQGVIHRDIKPGNILLDEQKRPKLTDFDLVRTEGSTAGTRTGMLGTLLYAAPEALMEAATADVQADVYGLGMTTLFALLGRDLPLDVIRDTDRFIEGLSVAPALRRFLKTSVAWNESERPSSAGAFCEALRAYSRAGLGVDEESAASRTEGERGSRGLPGTDLPIEPRQSIRAEIPQQLLGLGELAYNLWWTWSRQARELFSAIDASKWAACRNPVQLLISSDPRRWYLLLEEEGFRTRYQGVMHAFEDYMQRDGTSWFARHHERSRRHTIAYFSMEYGLHQSLPIYSGGLGVGSGDHCKAASDLGVPLVAVGLLYRRGYFQQTIDPEGLQQHTYPDYDFTWLPVRPIASASGGEAAISLPLPGRDLRIKLWLAQVGRVPLILLDTDLPENHPADRPISGQLYVSGREMRLLQEMVLGMGGVKALRAVGIEPAVWHLNEGHSALLQLERWRVLVQEEGLSFAAARARTEADSVFTTHTPVPAGNERFDPPLVRKYFGSWCEEVGLPIEELLDLGGAHDRLAEFNLTALAIRTTGWANGVSRIHAEVTGKMWNGVLRERGSAGKGAQVHAVTNGVHALSWMGPEVQDLLRRHLGSDWEGRLLDPDAWTQVGEIPDGELWAAHNHQKHRLARFSRSRLLDQYARYGNSPDELRAVENIFDPDALTIGFARRFATYKRSGLLFTDLERLEALIRSDDRPLQLLIAGKAHPADRPGQARIQQIFELSRNPRFLGRIMFLENYDMRMAKMLVQGVDVWLNTPRRPLEASGTSGMKAAMNGGLNLSVADGWWPEGWNGDNGWVIGELREPSSEEQEDLEDALSLYETLESSVLPTYYDRDGVSGLPERWIRMMKQAIALLTPRFSASRMVRDYAVYGYLPAAARSRHEDR